MKSNLSTLLLTLTCGVTGLVVPAQQPAGDPYEALAKFQFGQSRQPLALIEEQIRKTAPADYAAIEARLLPVLKAPETPKDAKRYICRWLGLVGSAACVPAVAELLTDPDLSHPARMALEPMPAPAAGAALRAALPKLHGKLLVGVIGSIGVRRDALAVEALSQFVGDTDPTVAGAAIAALGQIGTEQAALALDNARVPETLARTLARARLTAASHLAKSGSSAQAVAIYRGLMSAQQPQAVRVAALQGLIGALPLTDAVRLILDMLQGDDATMRAATISAFARSSDTAMKASVAAELPNMKPAGQLILLAVLADQPDAAARPGVLKVLNSANSDALRVAALECLAVHGEAADVPTLVGLASDPAAAVAAAARKTLQRLGKSGVDDALLRLVESPRPSDRAVVLGTLAARRVESALPILARLLGNPDASLATEAAKALGIMGKTEQIKDLAGVLASTDNATLRNAAAEAAKAICRRATDKPAAGAFLLSALQKSEAAPARIALLETLVYAGGEPALNSVLAHLRHADRSIGNAAARALIDWPDVTAGPHLIDLAKNTPDASQVIVVLRDGCLRLADMDDQPLAERVNILRGVLAVAKRTEEKSRALAALANMPSLAAMELLQANAKDPALQTDAVKAAIKLSRQLAAVYHRQTLAALEAIKAQAGTDELRAQVAAAIRAAQNAGQSPDGFILAWMLAGPFTEEGKDGGALFDIAFAPENASAKIDWRPATASKSGLVELDKMFRGENRVAYLRTQITSSQEQDAQLEMGSDDGIKVWLNGKVVHANNAIRPCAPGQDKVRVKLKQGVNHLLLKVTQGGGEWSACCRLRAVGGKELPDLAVGPSVE
ncbi:MAG: HEAT repeat domain-containing protein [Verrucomicrobia bacterium]|nr:HEAT repeat domain-containing protein [Verrucomicrobiota bacterium]